MEISNLTIETAPSVGFPVSGKNSSAIKSFWHASRDGGARKHEGVDIFAPRGTPVIAVSNGMATSKQNKLGGNTVWLYNAGSGKSYYYAHLDSQYVNASLVKIGDTLGTVGNTGNARTTAPHLHFGIYQSRKGAVNPLPFIKDVRPNAKSITADTSLVGSFAVTRQTTNFRSIPTSKNNNPDTTLSRNVIVKVQSAHSNWFRVELPDGKLGFVFGNSLGKLSEKKLQLTQSSQTKLLNPWHSTDSIPSELSGKIVASFGEFGNYRLVKVEELGFPVWVED